MKRTNNQIMIPKYIKKTRKPWIMAAADFETFLNKENRHELYAFAIIGEKIKISFIQDPLKNIEKNTALEFMNQLDIISIENKNKDVYIYMHNLGGFDGILLINALKSSNKLKKIKSTVRDNSIYQLKYKNIILRDSFKLIQDSLNNIAMQLINMKKKDIEKENIAEVSYISNNLEKIKEYCINDAEILFKSLEKFEKNTKELLGISITEAITVSSLAFKTFRKSFYKKENISNANHYKENIYTLLLESYRGGIVDVYKPYGENLNYYDINSSYPAAMMNYMPVGMYKEVNLETIDEIFFGFIKATIKVEKTYIPFLGTKNKEKTTNIYPYGTFTGTFFSEELKYAMKVNKIEIIKIIKCISYEKEKIFDEFVGKIYEKRKKTVKPVEKIIYKSVLNHLYGRFGMKRNTQTTKIVNENELRYFNRVFDVNIIANLEDEFMISIGNPIISENNIWKLEDLNKKQKQLMINLLKNEKVRQKEALTAPQIAAAITAYARINIDKMKRIILEGGGKVYYSDTDSIITDLEIETSNELGKWKLEKTIKKGYFISPKIYFIIEENKEYIKFKGLPHETKNKMNKKEFMKTCENIIKKQNRETITEFIINTNFRKDFKNMQIAKKQYLFKPKFLLKKRNKIIKNGEWIDTEPLNLDEEK